MDTGLYAAFLGMRARQRALDATANNIANASTAGFKTGCVLYESIEAAEIDSQRTQQQSPGGANVQTLQAAADAPANTSSMPTQPMPSNLNGRAVGVATRDATDFTQGALRDTGRPLDVALSGDGFLVVQTPRGERYMRAGNLTLDASGQLVTQRGDLVVGEAGPITIPPGEVAIGEDGALSVNGQQIDHLKIVRFADPRASLAKEGDSLFIAKGQEKASETSATRVVQGALETSNVNVVSEMVAMMQNGREFESLQRSVTLMMNDLGRKVSSEIGKI